MWCAYPPIIWTQRIVLSWRRKIKIPQSSVSELGCNHSLVGTHFSALNSSSDDISLDSLGHSCLDGSEAGLPWCNCSFHSSCVIAWSPCWDDLWLCLRVVVLEVHCTKSSCSRRAFLGYPFPCRTPLHIVILFAQRAKICKYCRSSAAPNGDSDSPFD